MLLQCMERYDPCNFGQYFPVTHIICGNLLSVDLDGSRVGVWSLLRRGNSSGRLGKKGAPHRYPAQRSAAYLLLCFPKLRITEYLNDVATLTSII